MKDMFASVWMMVVALFGGNLLWLYWTAAILPPVATYLAFRYVGCLAKDRDDAVDSLKKR